MNAQKAAGVIARLPCGRRPRGSPKRPKGPIIARAQRIIEAVMAKRSVPATPPGASVAAKPWAEMTKAEKLSANTDLSLDVTRQILELGVDPSDPKVLGHVKDTALTLIGQQIRLDSERLRTSRAEGGGRLDEFYRSLDASEREPS
jgi:hypothetical protein